MTENAASNDVPLSVDIDEAVAYLTFTRESAANAIDLELADAFRHAARRLVGDLSVRVVVIRGSAKFFSAGGDLASMLGHDDRSAYLRQLASTMHEAVALLVESRLLVVAAVEGAAAGAGFALVLDADIVIAAPTATFVSAYTQVGLTPDTGFSASAAAVVGTHRAKELVLLNRRLDSRTAHEWGIVTELVEAESFDERVIAIATELAGAAQPASAEAKRLIAGATRNAFSAQLADEADTISRMSESVESRQRIDAFARRSQNKGKTG